MENVNIVFCIDKDCKSEFLDFIANYTGSFISSILCFLKTRNCYVKSIRLKYLEFDKTKETSLKEKSDENKFDKIYSNDKISVESINHFNYVASIDYESCNPLQVIFTANFSGWDEPIDKNIRSRKIIVVYSKREYLYVDDNMMDKLADAWHDSQLKSKRLILYTPDKSPWNAISDFFSNVIHIPLKNDFVLGANLESLIRVILSSI